MMMDVFVVERLEYVDKSGKGSQSPIIRTNASLLLGVVSTLKSIF